MKSGNKLFIFTGAALAIVAILLTITMSSGGHKTDAESPKPSGKVKVVKAAVDFDAHKVIQPSDIVIEEMNTSDAPADAVVDPQLILNQGYQLSAKKGDILYSQFVEAPGIRNSVDAGMRAVSLSVNNQGMMSGLIMDGDYVDVVFKTRVDLLRVLDTSMNVQVAEDGPYQISGDTAPLNSDSTTDPQLIQGADGSNFVVTDAGQNLEPVAKIIVQDLKVIRVVPAGVTYDGQGQQVKSESDSGSNVTSDTTGQLILQASPDQAEVLSFIQDPNDSYEILVRGQDDHAIATTSGVTYQILMTDEQWALPWPKPIAAPGGSDKK